MRIQADILQFFETYRNDALTLLFTTITILAEQTFLVVILSILYWCVNKEKGRRLAWFVVFSALGNSMVKNIVQMPRPYEVGVVKPLRIQTAMGYSFPSGHTQSATSFWGGAMLIFKTRASIIVGSIMIILTALSRMYLGVHWPMDVLGGIGFGFICIYFADKLLNKEGIVSFNYILATSVLVLFALFFNVRHNLYSTTSVIWGYCIGAYIEQNYVKFEVTKSVNKNIYRIIIGMIGIFVIYLGIGKLLPNMKLFSMLKNALLMIWIIGGAPYFFKKIA